MDINRINHILNNDEKCDVFYENRCVWIQGVNDQMAKIGFVDNFEEKDVSITDLYEQQIKRDEKYLLKLNISHLLSYKLL